MTDTLTEDEGRALLAALAETAPLDLFVETSLGGILIEARGHVDGQVAALEIPRPFRPGESRVVVFPTCALPHWAASFFSLGPRAELAGDGVLTVRRASLDDPELRKQEFAKLPDGLRAALDHENAMRWSIVLRERNDLENGFEQGTEVYDCPDAGIWIVLPSLTADDPDAIVLLPGDSTTVWRGLSTMLPTADEWRRFVE